MAATAENGGELEGKSARSWHSPIAARWQKAQACQASNGCVELASLSPDTAAARDSVLGDASPVLAFDREAFRGFLARAKNGRYDLS